MTLDELKTRVKIKVDEYTPDGVSHSFGDYLTPILQESAKEMCDNAPLHWLEPSAITIDTATPNIRWENDRALIDTPSNFARIYEVDFPYWERPVRKALTPNDPLFDQQDNTYLKSGYGRPTVRIKTAEVESDALAKVLECGKVLDSVEPTTILYVAYKEPQDMPDALDEALTWLAASKILIILEYPKQAEAAKGEFVEALMGKK